MFENVPAPLPKRKVSYKVVKLEKIEVALNISEVITLPSNIIENLIKSCGALIKIIKIKGKKAINSKSLLE